MRLGVLNKWICKYYYSGTSLNDQLHSPAALLLQKALWNHVIGNKTVWAQTWKWKFPNAPAPGRSTFSVLKSAFEMKWHKRIEKMNETITKRTVFLDKDRAMENIQKHNIGTNVPVSQTFRS
jgi:hypothetical protein